MEAWKVPMGTLLEWEKVISGVS